MSMYLQKEESEALKKHFTAQSPILDKRRSAELTCPIVQALSRPKQDECYSISEVALFAGIC